MGAPSIVHFLLVCLPTFTVSQLSLPCSEISKDLRIPCQCTLGPLEPALDNNPSVSIDCDQVVFPGDFPALPYGAPVTSFRQRGAGYQALPMQLFTQLGFPLRSVDYSGNTLRRITERLLGGLQMTLLELRLADNLLGDTLNPIFSSSEFHGLKYLQLLELSGNGIKAIEEGILEGCERLQSFYLNRNSLTSIPGASLNGPKTLKVLSLQHNRIGNIKSNIFQAQQHLDMIDLSFNQISTIETTALSGLTRLRTLRLTHNRLSRLNSDVFQGAENLQQLDLAENFIAEFPTVALKAFANLRYLNLSSNLIKSLDNTDLASLTNLYHLDLSRNNIANIVPGTFLGLKQLRKLDISVNSLRTIEDDAFEGLDNLESLNLKDNNILLIPASALGRLPRLATLLLDYNRVAALSGDILRSIAEKVTTLVLSNNVVRELPSKTFEYFQNLQHLDMTRNLLSTLNTDAFSGNLENTLLSLKLNQNKITSITGTALGLKKLVMLDLSDNLLKELGENSFNNMESVQVLKLRGNKNLFSKALPKELLHQMTQLVTLDFSFINLKQISTDLFAQSLNLKNIYLNNNEMGEISDNIFVNLRNLTNVDLSFNKITNIRQSAFVNVMNLQELNLKNNLLTSFKGEFFNTGTSLELLDISNNQLSYLFPSSFRIHPRLKKIIASSNKFNFFPAELIANLQFLEYVDLSNNGLKTIEELDFARLPRLRTLLLSNNQIETISEMSFHNSTQLQILDLSGNKLDRIGERSFEGLVRLEFLNLENNLLSDLPELIFERSRLQMLENINLAHNLFEVAPLKSLQRQYFFVNSVDLSYNKIVEIPADDSVMVNIKKLDLSFNPLSEQTVINILGEPKTVREINLSGTGISQLTVLETPFLHHLNLSHNNITEVSAQVFERTTLLETLDLSYNKLEKLSDYSTKVWSILRNLQTLNLSSNPIESISGTDFDSLQSLRSLNLENLEECVRIEKTAFKNLSNLRHLHAFNYPKLGYLDIQGLLNYLPALESVNIETKDAAVGSDQLQNVLNSRLKELGLHGLRLRSLSSGTLSGLKVSNVMLRFRNTSLSSLPAALFFPVPRSSHITLDLAGNQLTSLNPQLLVTLEDRRGDLKIIGLEDNPIVCDCNARALRRWLPNHMGTIIRCTQPQQLQNKLLIEVGDDELTCEVNRKQNSDATTLRPTSMVHKHSTLGSLSNTVEPEIIWSLAPQTEKTTVTTNNINKNNINTAGTTSINNDDTLIISIVGGVVAFITILIIIICIIRLRLNPNTHQDHLRAVTMATMAGGPGSTCATCSVKGGNPATLYTVPPAYANSSYSATLPHNKMLPRQQGNYGGNSMGRMATLPYGYQGQQNHPYFIATYPSDEKIYR